ncbi:dTDP-4-dehydrorhamnose reductase [Pseudaestuariivita rosea]|uniref:dTDP-4-dehydrorhamnose reductase n=1 Tax=Pseudaestuariivita rosea TaxID=2763263 RepID=UPI001ABB48E2
MILVFGKTGQVASALDQDPRTLCLGRNDADLTNPEDCAKIIQTTKPQAVINAAAYTAVDQAEDQPDLAMLINGTAPGVMAQICAGLDIPFIHLSTDYVFDGAGCTQFKPTDQPNPINTYGRTKLQGEQNVQAAGARYIILRTSWIFSAVGTNFVKTMLRLGASKKEVSVVADQIGGPTPAGTIGQACLGMIDRIESAGVYHFSGHPYVSWADFAKEVFRHANVDCHVLEIGSEQYPALVDRPKNARLDCGSLMQDFQITRPDWREFLPDIIWQIRNGALDG